jgi:hypothetical protein
MTDNDSLERLLRTALPLAAGDRPSRDLWVLVERRLEEPTRWSMVDLSLAAIIAITLLMFPSWMFVLAYQL